MSDKDAYRLSSPAIFLVRMAVFLILVGFVVVILHRPIRTAFMANPGLNSVIVAAAALGVFIAIGQVARLFREIAWVNARENGAAVKPPALLAPMARIVGTEGKAPLSPQILRLVLDSVATRLDESRETLRYLTGLLVFLGLLGTFWGLLETVGSIGGVIGSLQGGGETASLFNDLKSGLARPLAGMSLAFTSSLFGLAGSLVLGFLDLQAGQAQGRFYTELEDRLSADVEAARAPQQPGSDASEALEGLATGVQALVRHMRQEQQMIRDWVEAQADRQARLQAALEAHLVSEKQEPR
ncbi:MotA/TolQ/ExbB proton channel family protein [Rhodoblastus acidophilus]|uniref:MotA/TolQ/ExbB proton channel family protein n=1 Tax=Candidatus Rhodoblastus alkanivorans TaxID=2954117 RepID=A0ABS9ZE53_9HYPH|nr:MotA/TolQ/ExbB proton channel family protein [Candidatus Rhodoblastus alkanivorans]MCI4677849.1 MotA/TolQ/ExbB proton channel family protein [Candidatus Rhodoblastus alkanivorans]MCI4684652.1 MotA/TolQ/ExbB proton channel family protein [Candidatus Rhodoblastus alkanivorans]MDI4641974.1 MotA/TolQ/ExbB proton channel family protein [Rhodoblastus acidophilus]